MATLPDLTLDDCFVIHVLDNRLPAVQCSEALTTLPDGFRGQLETYLQSLFRPGFRRKRFGRFLPDSPVLSEYRHLMQASTAPGEVDPGLFLEVSQRLADLLFSAMRRLPRNGTRNGPGEIAPGDLLVGLCAPRTPEGEPTPYLFLIKVDLESGLQRQVRQLETGGMQTVLTPCEGLIPKLTGEHVHKTALIKFQDDASMYDVVMTDPQGGRHEVAKFFAEQFLHIEPFHTPDEQAELLFIRTHAWVTEHEETLSPREQQEVLQSVRTLVTERTDSIEPLAPRDLVLTLPLTETRTEQTVQELRQSYQEALTAPEENGRSIPPDQELLLRTVPPRIARTRVTFQLDHGVQLSGEPDAIERLFTNPPHRVGERTEFTIQTTTFRPTI